MTLNGVMAVANLVAFPAHYVKVVADTPTLSVAEYLLRYT